MEETDFLSDLLSSIQKTKDFLSRLEQAVSRQQKEFKSLVEYLTSLESSGYISIKLEKIVSNLKTRRVASLTKKSIRDAVTENTEFAYPALLSPLLECAEDENIVTMVLSGTGWSTNLLVTPNFDEVAGNINDWSEAIQKVRDSNDWNSDHPDPNFASMIWKKLVYRGDNYSETIDERLSASSSPAPYWEILNNGVVGMSSDWGGYPYPVNKPTMFVENIKSALEEEFILNRDSFHNEVSKSIEEGSILAEKYKYLIESALKTIEDIKNNLDDPDITARVAAALNKTTEQIAGIKLGDFRRKIELGESTGRWIELTAKGEKVRTHPRTQTLRRILDEITAELEVS